jgi:hypothetical protein
MPKKILKNSLFSAILARCGLIVLIIALAFTALSLTGCNNDDPENGGGTNTTTVATPVITTTPSAGEHASGTPIILNNITVGTTGATIRFTTNDTPVTASSPEFTASAAAALNLTVPATIRARAFREGWTQSNEAVARFTTPGTQVAMPTITSSPSGLSHADGAVVTVTIQATTGDVIRYTLNGQDPTSTSTIYIDPFPITVPTMVKARAFRDGNQSPVREANFTVAGGGGSTNWPNPTNNLSDPNVTLRMIGGSDNPRIERLNAAGIPIGNLSPTQAGITWIGQNNTLILTSFQFITNNAVAMMLPAGSTIVLNSNNIIRSNVGTGSGANNSNGTVALQGGGNLTIIATGARLELQSGIVNIGVADSIGLQILGASVLDIIGGQNGLVEVSSRNSHGGDSVGIFVQEGRLLITDAEVNARAGTSGGSTAVSKGNSYGIFVGENTTGTNPSMRIETSTIRAIAGDTLHESLPGRSIGIFVHNDIEMVGITVPVARRSFVRATAGNTPATLDAEGERLPIDANRQSIGISTTTFTFSGYEAGRVIMTGYDRAISVGTTDPFNYTLPHNTRYWMSTIYNQSTLGSGTNSTNQTVTVTAAHRFLEMRRPYSPAWGPAP